MFLLPVLFYHLVLAGIKIKLILFQLFGKSEWGTGLGLKNGINIHL